MVSETEIGDAARVDDLSIITKSRRRVYLRQMEIRVSTLDYLAGDPLKIRAHVLEQMPNRVKDKYGQTTGLLLNEPPPGPLPTYAFFVLLRSLEPVKPSADFSSLVVVWFEDSLPENVPAVLAARLDGIDWEKHAVDGEY
jgi:hypothetical protein